MPDGRASPATSWPWTGRDDEQAAITAARAERGCAGGRAAGAEAGKSRLAREAAAAGERDGATVAWVQATASAAAVPLGAFAGLLPGDARADDALELMRRTADLLRERARGRPASRTRVPAQSWVRPDA